jgi:cytochrome c oxidase subunit 1
MPRRVVDYLGENGLDWMNQISSIGSGILGASTLVFMWNVWRSLKRGEAAGPNPWEGHTLEWATSSPPPEGNFDNELPPIRSNRPVWDALHPEAMQVTTDELGGEEVRR